MSWAALTSGGKDSILACQKAIDAKKEVGFLVTVRPDNRESYMFHSANLDAVPVIARSAGMEYVEIRTHGRKEEELADLEEGLSCLPVEGIVVGAVASV
jgi:diphthine-ammonia ligase